MFAAWGLFSFGDLVVAMVPELGLLGFSYSVSGEA
jgi:hypothetical protein